MNIIDSNIRNGMYSKIIDFTQDLNKLKAKILKTCPGALTDEIFR